MKLDAVIDVLHYGGALALLALGVASMAGVHIPGVQVSPEAAIAAAFGILGAGLKSAGLAKNTADTK